jgi:hypothetical protein
MDVDMGGVFPEDCGGWWERSSASATHLTNSVAEGIAKVSVVRTTSHAQMVVWTRIEYDVVQAGMVETSMETGFDV